MSDKNFLVLDYEDLNDRLSQVNEYLESCEYTKAASLLRDLHPADISNFFETKTAKEIPVIIDALQNIPPEFVAYASHRVNQILYDTIGSANFAAILEDTDVEEAVQVLSPFDKIAQDDIFQYLNHVTQSKLKEGFSYDEDSVGRIMKTNFIVFTNDLKVSQALHILQNTDVSTNFYAVIIVDSKKNPVGYVFLSELIKANGADLLVDIAHSDLRSVKTSEAIDDVTYIFKQYGLTIVPVINKIGKLVGTVSIDSVLNIVEQQAEEEILHFGGVNYQDTFYDLVATTKHRFPWLFFNLIIACLTAIVINCFSATILKFVALAAIMPVVASVGGNAGMQVMTVTIRALINKDISSLHLGMKIIIKEFLVCLFNGCMIAAIGSFLTFQFYNDLYLSLIFGLAIIINFVMAGIFGSTVPIVLDKMNIDPTTPSSVIVSAITDSFGFFCFLLLSYMFLS